MKHNERIIDGMNIGVVIALVIWFSVSGCTINRTGSALPDVNILNGSLNGNDTNVKGLPL